MENRLFWKLMGLLCTVFLYFGCSQVTDGSSANLNSGVQTGHFIDSPLKGLHYETSSGLKGTTDENGTYSYNKNDTITFYIGSAQLGNPVMAQNITTPCTITGAVSIEDNTAEGKKALKIVQIFLTLDTGEHPFGLTLPNLDNKVSQEALNEVLESEVTDTTKISSFVKSITGEDKKPASVEEAIAHYNLLGSQLDSIDNTALVLGLKLPDETKYLKTSFFYDKNTLVPNSLESNFSGRGLDYTGETFFSEYKWVSAEEKFGLNKAKYWFQIFALQDKGKVQVGDVISFYTPEGFKAQPSKENFPLDLRDGKTKIIHSDLTEGKNRTVVSEVYTLTGTFTIPNSIYKDTGEYFLYCSSNDGIKSLSLQIKPNSPVPSNNNMVLSYTTSLPAGTWEIQLNYVPYQGAPGEEQHNARVDKITMQSNNTAACFVISI